MLDADLAEIYGYSTKAFNQQVKNNIEKFDDDFRFQLTRTEYREILGSKFLTLEQGKYSKTSPYAFTEQGIYMLMTVLKGERATAQSKALIRLFKQMKDYIVAENHQLLGTAGIAQIAAQTAQNTHEIAVVSAEVKELSGEVRDIRSDLGKNQCGPPDGHGKFRRSFDFQALLDSERAQAGGRCRLHADLRHGEEVGADC